MNIWVIRAGKNGEVEKIAYRDGYALIGWAKLGDISDLVFPSQIKERLPQEYVRSRPTGQIYTFKEVIGIGDICILPKKRRPKGIVIGYFTGEYEHLIDNPELGRHGRKVEWVTNIIPFAQLGIDGIARNQIGSGITVSKVKDENAVQWVNDILNNKEFALDNSPEFSKYNWLEDENSIRNSIEAAIENCSKEKISSGFQVDYWVRPSTNKYLNMNYPSKIVARNISDDCEVSHGGWKLYYACTVLHNSGYIIMDREVRENGEDNVATPIKEVPDNGLKRIDSYSHLICGETRIRKVIFTYFLAPKRQSNESTVEINVHELHDMIGLEEQHQTVFKVLETLDQIISGINLVSKPSIDNFTAEPFIFEFTERKSSSKPNLILYGPPGTGKTYETTYRAVEICIGESKAKLLKGQENRSNLKKEYEELRKDKRIEFVTFHQSYSYQEFVEGLRPETKSSKSESKNGNPEEHSGGFELTPRDGIFKSICNRARSSSKNFVLIIDEINRANISKVFGELITLLEEDKRIEGDNEIFVKLPYSSSTNDTNGTNDFGVPRNLYIIGTMNTADRSIALLDTALRRRFAFEELMPNFRVEGFPDIQFNDAESFNLPEYLELVNTRIECLIDREHQIGHAQFMRCKNENDVKSVFKENIIPLLAEYFFENWEKIAKVLEKFPEKVEGEFDGCFLTREELKPNFIELGSDEDLDPDDEDYWRWTVKDAKDFDFKKLMVGKNE